MRTIGSAILATVMLASSAFAATTATVPVGPLAPGKPAGVKKAQESNTTLLWVIGAGLVIGGIALVASGNGNDNVGTQTNASGT